MPELARHVQTHLGLPPADVVNEVEDKKDHVLGLEFRYWGIQCRVLQSKNGV